MASSTPTSPEVPKDNILNFDTKQTGKQKHYLKKKGRGKKELKNDPTSISEGRFNNLPTSVSKWNIRCLDSLRIFYSEKFLPWSSVLDMVYNQTGWFGPLTPEQRDYVKCIHDSMEFSFSFDDLETMDKEDLFDQARNGLKKDMEKLMKYPGLIGLIEAFTRSVLFMIMHAQKRRQVQEQISEAVFVDLFKKFVDICGLFPCQGEEFTTITQIHKDIIYRSTADVVILAGDILSTHPVMPAVQEVTVVSIVEVKNIFEKVMDGNEKLVKKTRPVRESSSESSSSLSSTDSEKLLADGPGEKAHAQKLLKKTKRLREISSESSSSLSSTDSEKLLSDGPEIFRFIRETALAKHGADLLAHGIRTYDTTFLNKENYSRLFPGMIVIGTEVSFTLMEMDVAHVQEITRQTVIRKGKSIIHYSEIKDMLKKEDRQEMLEVLVRLNNRKQE